MDKTKRDKIVGTLGDMMYQAARASVSKGAIYNPGENISQDAEGAWRGIADTIVNLVEKGLVEAFQAHREIERGKE